MSYEATQNDGPPSGDISRVILRITGLAAGVQFGERGAGKLFRKLHDHDTPLLPDLRVACDRNHIYVDAIVPTPNQLGVLNSTIEEVDSALLASYLLPAEISAARMSINVPNLATPYAWQHLCETPGTNITSLARDILSENRDHNMTTATSNYIQSAAIDLLSSNL